MLCIQYITLLYALVDVSFIWNYIFQCNNEYNFIYF